jgi:hypothetical protein
LTNAAVREELGQTGNKFNAIIYLYSSEGGVRINGEQVQRFIDLYSSEEGVGTKGATTLCH